MIYAAALFFGTPPAGIKKHKTGIFFPILVFIPISITINSLTIIEIDYTNEQTNTR